MAWTSEQLEEADRDPVKARQYFTDVMKHNREYGERCWAILHSLANPEEVETGELVWNAQTHENLAKAVETNMEALVASCTYSKTEEAVPQGGTIPGTYENYTHTEDKWTRRVYYSVNTDECWLLLNPEAISLPSWIEHSAKGTMKKLNDGIGRLIKRGRMTDPRHADETRQMAYWYFADNKEKEPIDINQWPGPKAGSPWYNATKEKPSRR